MGKLNVHVLLVGVAGLFVAGGPLVAVLTVFHVSAAFQTTILQGGAAIIALLLAVGAIVKMATSQTDGGKASTLESLSPDDLAKVIAKMSAEGQVRLVKATPNDATLHAVNQQPEVKQAILTGQDHC